MSRSFEPTRTAGLEALRVFTPRAGRDYASRRNYDLPGHPHVSGLSPYLRHRMLTEAEVLQTVLARHSPAAAEKFVQEIYWRTYFKGWLEQRPSVWSAYRADLVRARDRLATEAGLRRRWEAACLGTTGLGPFDHWARELVDTGYLHNHARMWFASIWTFTLQLSWVLGADFFLRHLLDGDAASNTLGWRWVVGLHTPGKVYAARESNIATYTECRLGAVSGLAAVPLPAEGRPNPPRSAPPVSGAWDPALPTGLLLTEDDLSPGWLLDAGLSPVSTAVLCGVGARSPLAVSPGVRAFTSGAVSDAMSRYRHRLGTPGPVTGLDPQTDESEIAQALLAWVAQHGLKQIVVPYPPVGPAADCLSGFRTILSAERPGGEGLRVITPIRAFDQAAWPHATHGFFRFKDKIPALLAEIGGRRAA